MIQHLRPAIAVICGGLLALSFPLIQPATSQPATRRVASPTPRFGEIENVEFDGIVSSPPFTDLPPSLTIGLSRITLAPGGVLDIDYGGPAMYFVESGEVRVSYQANAGMALIDAFYPDEGVRRTEHDRERDRSHAGNRESDRRDRRANLDGEQNRNRDDLRDGVVLGPGQAISANYGNLGRTTNVGDGPATILAIVTAPYDESAYESASFEVVTAVPMPTKVP